VSQGEALSSTGVSPSQLLDLFTGAVGSGTMPASSSSLRPSPQVSIKLISMKGEKPTKRAVKATDGLVRMSPFLLQLTLTA